MTGQVEASPATQIRSSTRLLVLTSAYVCLNVAAVTGVVMIAFRAPASETVIEPIRWFLHARQGQDSWRPMERAYRYSMTPLPQRRSFYQKLFYGPNNRHKGYQYPPSALLPVLALDGLAGRHWPVAIRAIAWMCVPFEALIIALILRRAFGPDARVSRAWIVIMAVLVTMTFYPFIVSYRGGQIQTWINTLYAAAFLLWMEGRRKSVGALLGLAAIIKPQLAFVALWALMRGEIGAAAGFVLVVATGLSLSIAAFGWSPHVEYVGVLRYIAERGETFFPNQSFNGLMNRWVGNGLNAEWMERFPDYHPVVYAVTLASSIVILGLALMGRPARHARRAMTADFALAGLAATMASPIAWDHHYGIMLPIYAFLLPTVAGRRNRPLWIALAVSHALASPALHASRRLADTPWNPLQSYLLAGALVAFVVLHVLRCTLQTEGTLSQSPKS
ncbi:MAG: DUF2029 domain-containing protein [Vicinamibacteria bacterium]|nr:DUF2029 domain-containing protein [Vicinamibacteria bacterium]